MVEPGEFSQIKPHEVLSPHKLNFEDQSRLQSGMEYSSHILWGDNNIPPMVYAIENIPSRISDAQDYYARLSKTVDYGDLLQTVSKHWKGSPLNLTLDNGVRIESLQDIGEAVVTNIGGNLETIAYSNGTDMKNIRLTIEALQKASEVIAQFGIAGVAENHILLLNAQLPIFDSQHNPFENVTIVGMRGVTSFDQTEILAIVAHEGTHARFGFTLDKEFGLDPKQRTYYSMATLLEFLDEGTAVLAQQAQQGTPSRKAFQDSFDKMHPKAKAALLKGEYDPKVVYKQNGEDEVSETDPVFLSIVHARDLPGAFVEYCVSKGIKVQDLMGVFMDKLNLTKSNIAKSLGIGEEDVSLNWQQIFLKMKEQKGEHVTDEEEKELQEKVWKVADEFDMRPFQVLAIVDGSNDELKATHDFLEWAELKAA